MRLSRPEIKEEAENITLQGGEIPEVALHESLHYLAQAGLEPWPEERRLLEEAVVARYQDLIRRDLDPSNQSLSAFRSPKRARINLKRLLKFAERGGMDMNGFIQEAGMMLMAYLTIEAEAAAAGRDYNTLSMDRGELAAFMNELGLVDHLGLAWIDRICSLKSLDYEAAIRASRDDARD